MSGDYEPTDFFETAAMLITFIILGKWVPSAWLGPSATGQRGPSYQCRS